jgi:inhibitor of KinA sporulation pathway (predicted exonuclease)
MKIVVLDVEMNKPTRSIIEIGAYCVDLNGQTIPKAFSQFVNPKEILDPFIIDLCGIKQEDVDTAPCIESALEIFWHWVQNVAQTKNLSAWGSDVWMLIEASRKLGVVYPDRLHNLNIKEMANVFRSCYPQSKQRGGLKATMELFGLEWEGRAHRALVDSINTAKLLRLFKDNMNKYLNVERILKNI